MLMFFNLIRDILNSKTPASSGEKHQNKECVFENDEVELLKLKYEKLQYIDEKERERDKTVEFQTVLTHIHTLICVFSRLC